MIPSKIKSIFNSSKDWTDFNSKLNMLSNKEKGDCFEWLIKFYLLLHPKYKTKLKNVWLLNFDHVPSEVRNHLNLPSSDEGIDLIAETKEGQFWAIQSKYRQNENHSLNRQELSTFTDLAFNICRGISHALICTNSFKISRKFSLYKDNVSFCTSDIWCSLDIDFFDQIREFLQGKIIFPKKLIPRKHQQEALICASEYFKDNRRGKLIHPCSAGKTLTAYWIARELKAQSILVVVPSLSLVNQTLEEWANRFIVDGLDVSWICVCSDQTVGNIAIDSDETSVQDLGIEVFTDPKAIANWLTNNKSEIKVIFSTYQSGLALTEAVRSSSFLFDFAVMDEAHKTVGQKGSLFTHLLSDENITISKRLFMTATERRFRGDSDKILSMDQESVYGQTIHLYTFKEAIEDGILCDYKLVAIYVTEEEVRNLIESNFYIKPIGKHWKKEVESQVLASAIALRKAYAKYGFSHALSYHNSLSRASVFVETQILYGKTLLQTDPLRSFHIEGKTPAGLRKKIFQDFVNASMGLITNVRCLTEGVNIPKIDSILFADPKKSKVDIAQAVGRALRPCEAKKISYILVPVLIDETINDLELIKDKTYAALLQLICSLATQDERIIEYFRGLSNKPKRGVSRDYSPFEIDIPINIDIDLLDFQNSIELCFLDKVSSLSWRSFEDAREWACSLNLSGEGDWRKYTLDKLTNLPLLPNDIPATPSLVYKNSGWVNWGYFLGTGNKGPKDYSYRSFAEVRAYAHSLNLKTSKEWDFLIKSGSKPNDIPAQPDRVYKKNGWTNWGDFLGTNFVAPQNRIYRSFEESKIFANTLALKNQAEWFAFAKTEKRPQDIPAYPNEVYANKGWTNWGDFLGTGFIATFDRIYKPFVEARAYMRSLNLKNYVEWKAWLKSEKKPEDIPANPYGVYKRKGWQGLGDFLGTGTIAPKDHKFRTFAEACLFARELGLKGKDEWAAWAKTKKRPRDIPANPSCTYKNQGWTNWGDFLGTGRTSTKNCFFRSFLEARDYVRSLNLKSTIEWRIWYKTKDRPRDIPAGPSRTYKNQGWINWGDFLGTGRTVTKKR